MLIRHASDIAPSEITPKDVYLNRRALIGGAGAVALAGLNEPAHAALSATKSPFSIDDAPTPLKDLTSYNNFSEFGFNKSDPAKKAGKLTTKPWTLEIDGLVAKPQKFDVADLLKSMPLEERIYRLRCVETWSLVAPWIGFPVSALLSKVEPLGSAKYVRFETALRPSEMPGVVSVFRSIDWPYREALRIDEAMHPLAILAVGLYGDILPNQNGAPIRLVVPWKYGFKSAKSIVRITLTEQRPATSWNRLQPDEYGFFANVNPAVDHPRWSQAYDRPIGAGLFARRKPTLPFNGYAEQVAGLYAGMDLAKDF
jgi:sulfoxide reductase catalytic subunit YedY